MHGEQKVKICEMRNLYQRKYCFRIFLNH